MTLDPVQLARLSFADNTDTALTALATLLTTVADGETHLAAELEQRSAEQRAAWGRKIAADDPRPGVGVRPDGLPDLRWHTIPAGEYLYGLGPDQQQLWLDDFWIAQYPITYQQFQAFLDAPDGFAADRWWAEFDRPFQQQPMSAQWFKYANHPRDNVSWFQAVAFTRWLNAVLPPDGRPAAGDIRLPTEWEWEKAARGTTGRRYPWGDEYRPGFANLDEGSSGPHYLQLTTAVGLYPHAASPYGVHDLCGNVWEWCLNQHANPHSINLSGHEVRVVRGGAWDDSPLVAHAAFRAGSLPVSRYSGRGFRVVLSSFRG